jgi:hypothetical protein
LDQKVFGFWLLHNRMHSWLFVRILPTAAVKMVLGLGVQRASVLRDFFKGNEVPDISSIINLNIRLRLIKFNIDNKYYIYCTYCTYDPEVSISARIVQHCTIYLNIVMFRVQFTHGECSWVTELSAKPPAAAGPSPGPGPGFYSPPARAARARIIVEVSESLRVQV